MLVRSLLAYAWVRKRLLTVAERQIEDHTIHVTVSDERGSAQAAAALRVLRGQQVALTGTVALHLAGGADFEALGNCFAGLDTFWATHKIWPFLEKGRGK